MMLALWSDLALACAVCTNPNDPRQAAYFDMTIFLSLLPLGAMALVGFWLYRRAVAVEAEA